MNSEVIHPGMMEQLFPYIVENQRELAPAYGAAAEYTVYQALLDHFMYDQDVKVARSSPCSANDYHMQDIIIEYPEKDRTYLQIAANPRTVASKLKHTRAFATYDSIFLLAPLDFANKWLDSQVLVEAIVLWRTNHQQAKELYWNHLRAINRDYIFPPLMEQYYLTQYVLEKEKKKHKPRKHTNSTRRPSWTNMRYR